jgi:hypothetical protein
VLRDVERHVGLGRYAPSHSHGFDCLVPAGTVVIAFDQRPGATAFICYPEDYDRMEKVLIPEIERESFRYANFYGLHFKVSDIGEVLEPLDPVEPRPPNRFPRVSGRPSPRQRADDARYRALGARVRALEYGEIAEITNSAWVRRKRGTKGKWEVWTPDRGMVPLETCDIWLDDPPGDPPREPDVSPPGGPDTATNYIWRHQEER